MSRQNRIGAASGVAALVVTFGTILLAAILSPTFTWAGHALSDLGASGEPTASLFNGGLIVGALLGLPFAWRVGVVAGHPIERTGAVVAALAFLSMGLVGVYPLDHPYHFPAAIAFFALATLTLWIHGTGAVLSERPRAGLVMIWLGIGHVIGWVIWGAGLRPGPGLALPELVGSIALAAWIVLTARSRLLDRS